VATLLGCHGGDASDDSSPDSGVPALDAGDASAEACTDAADGEIGGGSGCTLEGDEDCDACWKHIGICCFDDPSILGRVSVLAYVCTTRPSCKACCNECANLPCEVILARHDCPNRY
jgi:hypothetical protein